MHNRKKPTKGQRSIATAIVTGAVVSGIMSMILISLASTLILGGILDAANTTPVVYVILFLSAFFGAVTNVRKRETHIAITAAAIAAVYLFILITINIICYNGTFEHLWSSLGITAIATALSALIAVRGRKGKNRRYVRPY